MGAKLAREVRREEITTTARDLFICKGFHRISVPNIARAAGINTGLINHIFPNKADILLTCCAEVATFHLDFFQQTVDSADRRIPGHAVDDRSTFVIAWPRCGVCSL